jgi:alpha-1,3-rhamnosyl/mannosyltransferase
MNIGLDARWIFDEPSGIGVYTRELIRAYAVLPPSDRFVLFFENPRVRDRTVAELDLATRPNFTFCTVPYGLFSLRNQLFMPRLLKEKRLDVFHSPNYMIPLCAFRRRPKRNVACVVTIHDVIPLIFSRHAPRSRKSRLYPLYRWLMLEIAARADGIISDSESSRADVIRHLRIPPPSESKVCAVPCGVAPHFRAGPESDDSPAASPDDTQAATVLYVGRSDPYKNLPLLVQAFATARKTSGLPLRLVIAGPRDFRYPDAENRARDLGVAHAVHWAGCLTDEALARTYRQAQMLVLFSRCEGFGLPVLEAMACGTPVICSDIPALRELAAGVALYVAPDDVAGLAKAMTRLATDAPLRRELSHNGAARAAMFTWTRTAERTLAVYRRAISAGWREHGTQR